MIDSPPSMTEKGIWGWERLENALSEAKEGWCTWYQFPIHAARVHTEKESNLYRQQIYRKPIKCYVKLYESLLSEHFSRIRYAILTYHK